ncbi:hypothetical protein WN51_07603 [Melipona quadrifasciata]|uniref:Uncharacterized protein n=1 Tax=Melipona quadrifasciata TaxID=166423 RepID=A0A0M8ZQM8_9HYME|nr:hypothetical protein WN51_07603 [Melipona quadrifasciata]
MQKADNIVGHNSNLSHENSPQISQIFDPKKLAFSTRRISPRYTQSPQNRQVPSSVDAIIVKSLRIRC